MPMPSPDFSGSSAQTSDPARDARSTRLVGYALLGLIVGLTVTLYLLSGASEVIVKITEKGSTRPAPLFRVMSDVFLFGNALMYDQVLLLAVIVAGALGGCIHVASSFSDYVGNSKYKATWQWWYMLRPFVGSVLALVFYSLIRSGMFSMNAGAPTRPSFYAAAGVAFLVGMFSKQASDKLDDLFDTLFKSDKDAQRADGLEQKAPVLTDVTPKEVAAGSPALAVVITGNNLKDAKLKVNDADHAVTSTADGEIKFTFAPEELAQPGTIKLTAFNAAGASTTVLDFTVTERRAAEGGSPDARGTTPGSEAEIDPAAAIVDTSGVQDLKPKDPADTSVPGDQPQQDSAVTPAADGSETGGTDAPAQPDPAATDTQEPAVVGATATGDTSLGGDAQPPVDGGQASDSEETVRV